MKRRPALALSLLLAAGAAAAHGVRVEIGIGPYWGWGGWHAPWVYGPPAVVWVPAPPPRYRESRREPMAPRSVGPTLPDPVITARNGQDANLAEYDRQRCNRWAVTQPAALADAAEFQRTVARCLDGLGYDMKASAAR